MAFDHRSQLEDMAMQCGASLKRIPALKQLILQASREAASRAGLKAKPVFCATAPLVRTR